CFFRAEYGSMVLVSGLAAILFFGGWNGPIPIFHAIGWAYQEGETAWRVTGYIAQVAGVLNFILKATLGVTVMMWVRWTLPRLRIDQVMVTCLKYCVPISAITFLGATWWQYAMPDRAAFGIKRMPYIELAEQWPATNDSKGAAPVTQPTTRAQSGGGTSRLADNSRTD